jgi:hypothetical protein
LEVEQANSHIDVMMKKLSNTVIQQDKNLSLVKDDIEEEEHAEEYVSLLVTNAEKQTAE